MSMSTDVIGFVSEDDPTYKKFCKVLDACIEAKVEKLPEEVAEYFGSRYPDECLKEDKLSVEIPMKEYNDESQSGHEIIVSEIPEGVHKIRFVNSW